MSENQSPVVIENEYHVETVEQAIETEKRMGAASPETRKLMIQVAIAEVLRCSGQFGPMAPAIASNASRAADYPVHDLPPH